jgi:RNA polymerase sigma-70 factor (ECF subfamily)
MALPLDSQIRLEAAAESSPPKPKVQSVPADLLALLYRQVRSLAGPRADLDDLVQKAAERMVKAMPRFEGRSAFSTWAYGIAYRTVLDHDRWYRRWARRFAYTEESDPEPPSDVRVEDSALQSARAASLHRALAQLPPAKRTVILLHDLEGHEMKEVAEIVHTNERTVRSRLRDGRKMLAAILLEDPLFDEEGAR